ncbi:MAG: hypothetical protein AABZ47_13680 [Planctomycetota bacterium]
MSKTNAFQRGVMFIAATTVFFVTGRGEGHTNSATLLNAGKAVYLFLPAACACSSGCTGGCGCPCNASDCNSACSKKTTCTICCNAHCPNSSETAQCLGGCPQIQP